MSRHIPEHPEKGSPEAYAWAAKMKKARLKAKIRKAGLKAEFKAFGPEGYFSKKNPGARWHEDAAHTAGRYRKEALTPTERHLYAGMEMAHKDSARAARTLGLNPSMKQSRWIVTRLKDGATQEMSYKQASRYYGKQGYEAVVIPVKKVQCKKNPIAVYNPPPPKIVGTIYNKAIEIRAKKTGSDLAGRYKHVFGKNVKILGLDNGDVVIHHTGGKRLWISRKDYERSGGTHK